MLSTTFQLEKLNQLDGQKGSGLAQRYLDALVAVRHLALDWLVNCFLVQLSEDLGVDLDLNVESFTYVEEFFQVQDLLTHYNFHLRVSFKLK